MKRDNPAPVLGVVLAGGLARRMGGGDKPLLSLAGRSLLDHVLGRFAPQCSTLVLNVNGDPSRFGPYRLPVVADGVAGFPGPLAGILAGLDLAAEHSPEAQTIAVVPGDCPFLPLDLVSRLERGRRSEGADVAVAVSGERQHGVIGLWSTSLRGPLRRALEEEGVRKVQFFLSRCKVAKVAWPSGPVDPFFNVNTDDDLCEAERLVRLLRD